MASIRKRISVTCAPAAAWDAIRDVGALHTRLVPGFVVDTKIDGEARIVTFANGMVVREPIISVDDAEMRLAWAAAGAGLEHYNGSVQVFPLDSGGCEVLWIADVLPHERAPDVMAMMEQGMAAMKSALDRLSTTAGG